jgi:hypothetical protein
MTPLDPAAGALAPIAPRRAARAASTAPGTRGPAAQTLSPPAGAAGGPPSPQPRERLAAGTPDPGPGEADPAAGNRLPASPGRRRAPQTPAGGAHASSQATSAPLAGSTAIAAAMSEDRGPDSLDAHVRRLLRDLGLRGYHTHDSRRSEGGYPDWTITGTRTIFR